MTGKKHILVFIDWYLPGFKAGGPIQSVAALTKFLGDEYDFSVITSDTDVGGTEPYPGIRVNEWTRAPDGTRIFYCRRPGPDRRLIARLMLEEQPDIIYYNSLFTYPYSILPLQVSRKLRIPARSILAPRGVLGANALKIKRFKKKLFITWARLTGLYNRVTWHASSEQESHEIKALFGEEADVRVAMNLPSSELTGFQPRTKQPGQVNLFFLSRVTPKKNLLGAIGTLRHISPELHVHFTIIGPPEDNTYLQQCRVAAAQLPTHVSVTWAGPVDHAQLSDKLRDQHFLFLPTEHENFGHVFLESWAASCPVIISDQTPWHGLAAKNIGWDIGLLDKRRFIEVVDRAARMGAMEYRRWSEASYRNAECYAAAPDLLQAHRQLFS